MLSENLEALALRLGAYIETGMEFSPEAVDGLCAVLEAAAEDARALEAAQVGEGARVTDDEINGSNVTRLTPRARPRPVSPTGGESA